MAVRLSAGKLCGSLPAASFSDRTDRLESAGAVLFLYFRSYTSNNEYNYDLDLSLNVRK